jgi:flagellar motor switch protein FliN/FliY
MNETASNTFASEFVKGFVDSLGALQATTVTAEVTGLTQCSADSLTEQLGLYTAVLHATVEDGGGLAVLLNAGDVTHFTALVVGNSPERKETLADTDVAEASEIFETSMGRGVSRFKELYGEEIALSKVTMLGAGPDTGDTLMALLGTPTSAAFSYSVPDIFDGAGVVLFSESLESIIPAEEASQNVANDILGDFGKPAQDAAGGHENLDMVLDIRLNAVVRLGRIEMPIAEVLALGPGSIIEVGHAVDEPIELLVNGKLIARGDVVVVDEKFALRITELISPRERIESLR